jgi:hypothetical protein
MGPRHRLLARDYQATLALAGVTEPPLFTVQRSLFEPLWDAARRAGIPITTFDGGPEADEPTRT